MALVRYNSVFPGLANNLFIDFLADYPTQHQFSPKVDVTETEKAFDVHVSLPGFRKEDIKVELDENRLTISGERKWEKKEEDVKKKFHFLETDYGKFSRTFTLPGNVLTSNIQANYKDGILELNIPKEEKDLKKFQISVN
ncbi:MAG: Hsp20/alpha crystallin family protein [Opitutaceae bacterium]|nr:Hsp20/alpha crystallin family protein [Cytophagales bacterium]